jgi:hypothetical protein
MRYTPPGSGDLSAVKSDGTTANNVDGVGCTLTAGTWYFPFGPSDAPAPTETPYNSLHLQWDNQLAFSSGVIETCNFPKHLRGDRTQAIDVDDTDTTPGRWIPQNPPGAYVPIVGGTVGTGATVMTIALTAGNPGGCDFELGNFAGRRGHLKLVVTTGGVIRANLSGKAGG